MQAQLAYELLIAGSLLGLALDLFEDGGVGEHSASSPKPVASSKPGRTQRFSAQRTRLEKIRNRYSPPLGSRIAGSQELARQQPPFMLPTRYVSCSTALRNVYTLGSFLG